MTMARFKQGQEIICVNHDGWVDENGSDINGPQPNEIYTVTTYECDGFCRLHEFSQNDSWNDLLFEPVVSITELTEILEHQTQEI